MAAQVVRLAQVTGAYDHIRFQARCKVRQGTHVRGDMGRAWSCMELGQIQLDPRGTHCTRCGRDSSPCPIGNAWRAHAPMGLKGGSCDGGLRSYQVPSKTQGNRKSTTLTPI